MKNLESTGDMSKKAEAGKEVVAVKKGTWVRLTLIEEIATRETALQKTSGFEEMQGQVYAKQVHTSSGMFETEDGRQIKETVSVCFQAKAGCCVVISEVIKEIMMELVYLERRSNGFDEESATPEFIAAPDVESDSGKTVYKPPLPSDEKKSRSWSCQCQSCHRSSCSCRSDAFHADLRPTLPAKMMVLEFLVRSLRHPRRTHNVSDLDDMISDGASTGSVVLGPSEKMMLDSLHALVNAKTRPRSPSFFHPGAKTMRSSVEISHHNAV
ncbi:hypothetical protein GUJ93_ZPchr0006g44348 [Zizania palustris]|uniref:Uncharacterized protein n=1 Tax=Zizania palustris TaxID=103762 RepID=A0A8J5VVU0_ZIZPA|nr:hypothetical protein GUJ93_ZPchr0006g44348 [Zizania palustris]